MTGGVLGAGGGTGVLPCSAGDASSYRRGERQDPGFETPRHSSDHGEMIPNTLYRDRGGNKVSDSNQKGLGGKCNDYGLSEQKGNARLRIINQNKHLVIIDISS